MPLKYPRLKEGAVPSQFPNCPAYLSKQTTNRIAPDTRKEEKEIIMLNKVLEQSIEHKKLYDNARRIKNLDDILNCINNFGFNQTWTMSNNEKQIVLFLLGFSPAPFIKYSVIINADLEVKVFMKDLELKMYYPNFKSDDDDYEEEEYDDNNNFKTASFNSLIKLHEIESTKNLKYGHNLSLKALFPSSFEKQSVPFEGIG